MNVEQDYKETDQEKQEKIHKLRQLFEDLEEAIEFPSKKTMQEINKIEEKQQAIKSTKLYKRRSKYYF